MVTRGFEGLRHAFEDRLASVPDFGNFAMHEPACADDISPEDMADALMTEADAQDRNALTKGADHVTTDACFLWRALARGDTDVIRPLFGDLFQGDLIIPVDLHLRAHLAKVLDEVVGEGVVVIDDEEHAGEVPGSRFRD
jgi:hypothetical protein